VRAHILLEVKVGELILGLKLKKSGKLLVGVDLATIILVLELVGADVGVNLASDLGAGHLRTLILGEERGELVANLSRLDEATRGAVASLALLLGARLLGRLELAGRLLLEDTEISLERREHLVDGLELGHKLEEVARNLRNNRIGRLLYWGNDRLNRGRGNRKLLLGGGGRLLWGGGLLLLGSWGANIFGLLLLRGHII